MTDYTKMDVDELVLVVEVGVPLSHRVDACHELARLAREAETKERMLTEIHNRAGCKRDGLAGILGWIDDAKESVVANDDLRAKLAALQQPQPSAPTAIDDIDSLRKRCSKLDSQKAAQREVINSMIDKNAALKHKIKRQNRYIALLKGVDGRSTTDVQAFPKGEDVGSIPTGHTIYVTAAPACAMCNDVGYQQVASGLLTMCSCQKQPQPDADHEARAILVEGADSGRHWVPDMGAFMALNEKTNKVTADHEARISLIVGDVWALSRRIIALEQWRKEQEAKP